MKATRVLLLHNFLSPSRVPLFEALATRFDLEVWILGDIRAVRPWPPDAPGAHFRMRLLPHVSIPLGSRYNVLLFNYTLSSALRRLKPEVIVCCGWDTPAAFYAARFARRTKTPFVLWSGSTDAESTVLRALTKPLVRGLVRGARAWAAYGTRSRDYLVSLGAKPDRTFLAYNTVDLGALASARAKTGAAPLRDRLRIRTKYVALYCGNLLDSKGVGDLIEAVALLRHQCADMTMLLAGSGKHEKKYRARARECGIADRVVFAGFVQPGEIPSFYVAADLLVLPSRSEVWGLVINEALACGVPVVCTDACGAAPDLIRDGQNGFVVPARNPAALAETMHTFFTHPEQHGAMRSAARVSIAPFTIDRSADTFVDAVRCAMDAGE